MPFFVVRSTQSGIPRTVPAASSRVFPAIRIPCSTAPFVPRADSFFWTQTELAAHSSPDIFYEKNMKQTFLAKRCQLLMSLVVLYIVAGTTRGRAAQTNFISALDISQVQQGWGEPHANKSVDGHPLSLGGHMFTNGLGTHASSEFVLDVGGRAESFSAVVGVDDEVAKGQGSVVFKVLGDQGKVLWESKELHGGDAPQAVNVSLADVKQLTLSVDGGESIDFDHADWADAQLVMTRGRPGTVPAIKEDTVILTPKPSPKPRIHSAKVFGVRPGAPFLYSVAATGDRPMAFAADNLPKELQLDPKTGRITGSLKDKGEHEVNLRAKNSLGETTQKFKIVCGAQIGLTPAMGWNSWNCFASAVTAAKVKSAADAMVSSGLINHGWTYINVDDFWEVHRDSKDPTLQGTQRDADGHIIPNPRFPDMKGLADYVHAKGLKIGLYSSPGPWTCGGCVASWQHEELDAQSYGQWDFDYLKYDWCSYGELVRGDNSLATLQKPYRVMRAALDKVNRDILFSFCQYGMGNVWEWGAETGGNSWRTTGDINDSWSSMAGIGFRQNGHEKFARPGNFNDPDMLVVGKVGWGPSLHPTRLTPNEQYTHISLWCLLAAPLLIGCDMTQLDEFTLSLLTNDEVLEVNQDPLGRQAARVAQNGQLEVWVKDMEDGSKAVGLFNRGYSKASVTANWADLGLAGKQKVRDLWRQKDIGEFTGSFTASVPRHGVVLLRIWPVK
jgi:alpha-galactosidase